MEHPRNCRVGDEQVRSEVALAVRRGVVVSTDVGVVRNAVSALRAQAPAHASGTWLRFGVPSPRRGPASGTYIRSRATRFAVGGWGFVGGFDWLPF